MKDPHGGTLLLVNLQVTLVQSAKFASKHSQVTKSNTPLWLFLRFLNCTNDTKSRKASLITKGLILYQNAVTNFSIKILAAMVEVSP